MSRLRIYLRTLYTELPSFKRQIRRKKIAKLSDVNNALAAIGKYAGTDLPKEKKDRLLEDMMRMARDYHYSFEDYFYHSFPDLSDEQRLEYLSETQRDEIVDHLNRFWNRPLFADKESTYEKYKPYYKRELIGLHRGTKDLKKLRDFLEKHGRIILKPAAGSLGIDVRILNIDEMDDVDEILLSELKKAGKDGLVAEEVIIQDERLAAFHPQSLNCLRVTTVNLDDHIELFHSFLKMGTETMSSTT